MIKLEIIKAGTILLKIKIIAKKSKNVNDTQYMFFHVGTFLLSIKP